MKAISRRGFVKLGASSAAMLAMTPLLSACGNGGSTGGAPLASSGPVSASKAFAQKGVWFRFDDEAAVGKDEEIWSAWIFDGEGNVAYYPLGDMKFSDLRDETEKLEEFVKRSSRESFESRRSEQSSIIQGSIDMLPNFSDTIPADEFSSDMDEMNRRKSIVDSLEYKDFSHGYTLHVMTDGSGNATASESLETVRTIVEWGEYGLRFGEKENEDTARYKDEEYTIELIPASAVQDVYSMHFHGFRGFVTLVDEKHPGFALDDSKTDGIEVD